jgi:transcriptional regulator
MYTPAPFAENRLEVLHELIRQHPLATLISIGSSNEIQASHLPMVLDAGGEVLRGHMARANSHWETLHGGTVLTIFHGPQHYVSPNWYPSKAENGRVVPTWNYAAVHVTGRAVISHEREFLLRNVTDLTNHNEAGFPEPWRVDDAPESFIDGMLKAIVGFEIAIERIEGKWKLSQNREARDREGVVRNLKNTGTAAAQEMAAMMKTRAGLSG